MHDHQEFGRICVPSAAIAIPDAQESQSTVFNLSSFSQALRHMVRIFYGCGLAGCGCASLPVRYHQLNFPPVKELVGEATLEAVAWNRNDSTLGTDAMAYDANFAFVIALMEIRCFSYKTESSEQLANFPHCGADRACVIEHHYQPLWFSICQTAISNDVLWLSIISGLPHADI